LVSTILPLAGGRPNKQGHRETTLDIATLEREGIEAWAKDTGIFNGVVVGPLFERNPDVEPLWQRIIKRNDAENLARVLKLKMEREPLNWRSELGEIKAPTLIVAGERDRSFVDASRNLSRRIPDSKLMVMKDSGHMLTLEHPERFAGVFVDFLVEVGQVVPDLHEPVGRVVSPRHQRHPRRSGCPDLTLITQVETTWATCGLDMCKGTT